MYNEKNRGLYHVFERRYLNFSSRNFLKILVIHTTLTVVDCSETTLTGVSRFHISTPLGIEPRFLMVGSKWVVHWTSKTWCECNEIAGSPQDSPQQPTMSVVKPGPAVSVKPGQKSRVRSSGIITLSAWGPSDCSGRSPPRTRSQWSITTTIQTVYYLLLLFTIQIKNTWLLHDSRYIARDFSMRSDS